ncbi:MAG: hypothetical protein A2161_03835 [Candidatus Schekmanbacteria bacterium RBG_13_48_7]|uniref:Uncharacterized protein n=1 Tax=Candidatus Schekmanbacteria bacterium RBG_13_48_7 TaxID=1817878 RepID=A0A1F7S706_9BACT|nr:MAG: hypothetical protein A2161_03835 [Candidatus Schekmanbacteria bacterium RBG_13_48_7]
MKTILKRIGFLLLFSSGLALILAPFVGPFNDYKKVWRVDTDFVFISYASNPEEQSPDTVCNGVTFMLGSEYYDEFSFLREPTSKITRETWRSFIEAISGQSYKDQTLVCYEHDGEIYLVQADFLLFHSSLSDKNTISVTNILMNKYRFIQALPEISYTKMREFPSIVKALELRDENIELPGTFSFNLWKYKPSGVPLDEWRLFIQNPSIQKTDGTAYFKYNGIPYRGEILNTSTNEIVHVQNMNVILFYISLVCLVSSLFLTRGLYVRKKGIMTTPPGTAMILDAIIIAMMTLAMYMTIDYLLVKLLDVVSVVGGSDEKFQLMSIFFVIIGLPGMSFYISLRAGQSIRIDSTGILADELFSECSISWDTLKDVCLCEQQILRVREKLTTLRTLQIVLKLTGTGGTMISINEPVPSIKKKIINELLKHAPENWKNVIREKGSEW